MHPENKQFLIAAINSSMISVSTIDDAVMYHLPLPDGRPLALCADATYLDDKHAVIYYTVTIGDEIVEDAIVDTKDKKTDLVARDIIELMHMCSTKIMMQEAHLARSKYMIHAIKQDKTYS